MVLAATAFLVVRRIQSQVAAMQEQATGEIATVFIGDLSSTATASGQLAPQREAALALASSGRVHLVLVEVGDLVQAGDVLVVLESADLERAVQSAEQALVIQRANLEQLQAGTSASEIASSQASLDSARAALAAVIEGPTAQQMAVAEARVRAAEANLEAAREQYSQQLAGPTQAQILQAEKELEDAREAQQQAADSHIQTLLCREFTLPSGEVREFCPPEEARQFAELNAVAANQALAAAQARYDAMLSGASSGALQSAQGSIDSAQANLDSVRANLEQLQQPPSEADVASAEAQVAQAQASLEQLLDGPGEAQTVSAEAAVAQAEISLAQARSNLEKATLTAPFDGLVTAVLVTEGEIASGVAVQLADAANLEVVLNVDEIDLATLSIGQPATITFDSFPDVEIPAEVASIAPRGRTAASGIVTYDVRLALGETDAPLRLNMTANANLVTDQREDVLLAPNRAIQVDRGSGTYSVNRVIGAGQTEQVTVTIGLRDNQYTQITSGLEEGDEVVIGNAAPAVNIENLFGGG